MTAKNAFYAQSGGVTAVINATACGVIETARKHRNKIKNVYAGRNGIIGALREDLLLVVMSATLDGAGVAYELSADLQAAIGVLLAIATAMAAMAITRPDHTRSRAASRGDIDGSRSMVTSVEMLLPMEAREDTMAARSAAKTMPLTPVGRRFIAVG